MSNVIDMTEEYVDLITIPKVEYKQLLLDSDILGKLYAAGVDNWEWYEEALGEEDEEDA